MMPPSRRKTWAILRAPLAGWASRAARIRASCACGVRLGLFFGRRERVIHIVAVEPFVGGFTADTEAAGKSADVGLCLVGKGCEFYALFFHGEDSPRHGFSIGWDGVSVTHVSARELPMYPVSIQSRGGV